MPDKRAAKWRPLVHEWALKNIGYKLLSVALAVGGWTYVQGEQVVEQRLQAEVAWIPPVYLVPTEALPRYLSLTVGGPVSAVRRAQRSRVIVKADLSQAPAGETQVEFATLPVDGLPGKVSVVGVSPSAMRFSLDEGITRKVALRPKTVGLPGEGYEVVGVSLEPSVVEVFGPRTLLEALDGLSTMPIDVSGMAGDSNLLTTPDLPRQMRVVGENEVQAKIDLEPALGVQTFGGVRVIFPKGGWVATPREVDVRLSGPTSVLREIHPDQLLVVAHIPEEVQGDALTLRIGSTAGARIELVYPGDRSRVTESLIPEGIQVQRK